MKFCVADLSAVKSIARVLRLGLATSLVMLAAVQPSVAQEAAISAISYEIPSGSLGSALTQWAQASGYKLLAPGSVLQGRTTTGLSGNYAPEQALAQLLDGTGLIYTLSGTTVTVTDESSNAGATIEGAIALDTITVSGGDADAASGSGYQGTPDWVYQAPAAVSVISREAIQTSPSRNTTELFESVAGVNAADNPQNPGVNVNIRGLQDMTRINMMIDGARQNFQRSGHTSSSYVYVDPALLRGVEIEKSVTSGLGGAATLGGIVNFRTIRADDVVDPGEVVGSEINLTKGTNEYNMSGSAALGARLSESFSVLAAFSGKTLGEYDIGKNGEVVAYNGNISEAPLFTGLETVSGLIKANAKLSDDMDLEVSWLGYKGEFSYGTVDYENNDVLTNHTLTASYSWTPEEPLIDAEAKVWFNDTKSDEYRQARSSYDSFDVEYGLRSFGASLQNTSRFDLPDATLALNYGFEGFRDDGETTSVGADTSDDPNNLWFSGPNPNGTRDVMSGFSSARLEYAEWLTLEGGLRYDHYDLSGSASIDAGRVVVGTRQEWRCVFVVICNWVTVNVYGDQIDRIDVKSSEGRFLPSATLAVEPFDGVQLFGKYSEGYRPPTLMEAAFGGQHIGGIGNFGPNPYLEPEHSKTKEIGVNISTDGLFTPSDTFRMKAVGFDRDVTDYIGLGSVEIDTSLGTQSYVGYVNVDGITTMRGFELEANYDAGPAYIGLSATRTIANFADTYTQNGVTRETDTLLLYGPPKFKYTIDAGVRLLDRALTLGGRLTRVGPSEYDGDVAYQYVLEDYTVYDIYGSYAFDDGVVLRFAVDNVTDVAYVPVLGQPSYPAPGRTATGTLNLRF